MHVVAGDRVVETGSHSPPLAPVGTAHPKITPEG